MRQPYYLMNPGGNRTLLAPDLPRAEGALRSRLGRQLMALEKRAEQAGFFSGFSGEQPVLEMAGGEFCGNATLAAAVLYGEEKGLPVGESLEVSFRVSGAARPIPVTVRHEPAGWEAEALIPGPEQITKMRLPLPAGYTTGELSVVDFPGISHVILEQPMDRSLAEACVRSWCRYLGRAALGLMFFEEEQSRLTPLVYVEALGSLFWEGSCASGSCAVTAWLRQKEGQPVRLSLREPAGGHQVSCTDGKTISLATGVSREAVGEYSPEGEGEQ